MAAAARRFGLWIAVYGTLHWLDRRKTPRMGGKGALSLPGENTS
jgi:hypothetical protein